MSEQAVYARLSVITGLGGRVYPMVLPQNVVYPAATFQRITTTRYYSFGRGPRMVEPTIQVDVYGRAALGQQAFDAVTGTVLSARGTDNEIADDGTFIDNDRDDYEDDTELLRKSIDARVWYRE